MNIKNLLLATTAIMLAACSTDSESPAPQDPGQIRVTASVGAMTRVAHSGNSTTFVTGDRISVYAWTGSADAVPSAFVVDNSINTLGGDGTWTAEPQMLWADNTSDHYFLGIYPERDVITDYNADPYTLDSYNQEASDLLVAKTTAKPTVSAVKLEFGHVMAKLVVNLSFRNEWTTAPDVASVTAAVCTEATVDYLANPVKVTPATGQNLVMIPFTGTPASYAGIMIPGQSGFRTINVTLDNGKVYTYTHPASIDLQPGRYTTVNLVLGRDRIELDDAGINVSDWENGTVIDGAEANEAYFYDSNTETITIYSADGLKVVSDLVNGGKRTLNVILANDIDLTGIDWTPIGTSGNTYIGTFDGKDKTITGLTVTTSDRYAGLFGDIGSGGKVMNVKLEGVQITSDISLGYAGGIAGNSDGNIENCSVSGSVSGNGSAGGVVGYQYGGSITECNSSVTVKGVIHAGGIAGGTNSGASLTGCYATGDVTLESINQGGNYAGGVVGSNGASSTLTACYATGSVTSSGSGTIYAGGVTGTNDFGTLTACYHANGTISCPGGTTGGVAGRNYKGLMSYGGIITACYWGSNGQTQSIGEDQVGTGGTTMVTDGDWQKAVTQMNAALQSAGSEWQYELTGALPTLKKQ
ncbi:fimbrillin family protein [uncultured Alistipes sp.]|uniref:fimbrillin family protein n=1 Tax=uncultured Alistipes sp. TaxID=538949 RepID=UPI00266D8BE9|nr:fimbrillin family protein [uncultured Alistipes sp.]